VKSNDSDPTTHLGIKNKFEPKKREQNFGGLLESSAELAAKGPEKYLLRAMRIQKRAATHLS
jgi:hypothetical protein